MSQSRLCSVAGGPWEACAPYPNFVRQDTKNSACQSLAIASTSLYLGCRSALTSPNFPCFFSCSLASAGVAVATLKVGRVPDLGAYIREQRSTAQISLRQLARLAGVSNPYLSQIERGLRRPSAEILQQIAKALRISAEALYVKAG